MTDPQPQQPQQQVLVVGRGIYALPLLRILGYHYKTNDDQEIRLTFGSVGVGRQDMGSHSRFLDEVLFLPRPDVDLSAFTTALCAFVRGKLNLRIIPVVEETMYLSQIADQIRQANPSVRILASTPEVLIQLNEKHAFQKTMAEIHGPENVPQTSLVKSTTDTIQSIQRLFQQNKAAPCVVVKPLVGHGGIGAHIISRTDFEASWKEKEDFQNQYPLEFHKTPYVVQEFMEGQELSTFSLFQNGVLMAHLCYQPRYVGTHGFSPIRSLVSEARWKRTLMYIEKVGSTLKLTGSFGFDFIERFDGSVVALECNPRVTNGLAFFSPRFSVTLAAQMKNAYLLDGSDIVVQSSKIISPYDNHGVPKHTMTSLPTLSCMSKAKTQCETMQILELAAQAKDDVWWWYDPLPNLVMMGRIVANLLLAVYLSLVQSKSSISEIFRQFVVSEVVEFQGITEESDKRTFETVGGGLEKAGTKVQKHQSEEGDDNNSKGLRVLVTGATGFLGGRIVQILNEGFDDERIRLPDVVKSTNIITATGRNVKKGKTLMESLKSTRKKTQFIAADLCNAEETVRLVQGHDVVIHSAALCSVFSYWEDFVEANVTATANVAHACHICGVRMLVHLSSPSVCVSIAPGAGDIIDFKETDPLPPDDLLPNRYSVTKKKSEAIVTDVTTRYNIPCVILRPRALFGPGDTTLFPIVLDRLERRKLAVIGGRRDSIGDFTYVDNVVHACLCCLDKSPRRTNIYSITNDEPQNFWNVIDRVCDRMGFQKVQKSIPWSIAFAFAWLLEVIAALKLLAGFPSEPMTSRYGIGIVSKSTAFDISAAKEDLGYKPLISFDDGFNRFLDTLDQTKPLPKSNSWSCVEHFLASPQVLWVLLAAFVASQSWIGIALGGTAEKVGRLQTVCLGSIGSIETTGAKARQMLEEEWTEVDVMNFNRHFVVDFWVHPVIYGLFLTSAVIFELRRKPGQSTKSVVFGRVAALFIFLGSLCDVLENIRHNKIEFQFDPSEPQLKVEVSDRILWEASFFACTKWAIMSVVGGWLFWRYFLQTSPTTKNSSTGTNRTDSKVREGSGRDKATWKGPESIDFLNTPYRDTGLIDVQGRKIPWTLTDPNYCDPERSFTVSPFACYIGYGLDEVKMYLSSKTWIVRVVVETVVKCLGLLLQILKLDDCVYLNNWLLSTNLWPNDIKWSEGEVQAINKDILCNVLKKTDRPNKAIVWRSVDILSQPEMTRVLTSSPSCLLVPARIVNWLDYDVDNSGNALIYKKQDVKRDLKLFRNRVGWDIVKNERADGWQDSKYEMVTIKPEELTMDIAEQVVDLYNQLYLGKYSRRNPQVTREGIIRLVQSGFFTLEVLRVRRGSSTKPGRLVAFGMEAILDGVVIHSFVGYDMKSDADRDLFRLMMTMMIFGSKNRPGGSTRFHLSGGANGFKRQRGATSTVEYNAVFVDHLPFHQRLGWCIMKALVDKVVTVERAR